MQTFLPLPSFSLSAEALDYKRLGKQRLEALQIYRILKNQSFAGIPIKFRTNAFRNHPALLMWKGYEDALALYYNCIRTEWIKRGFKNTMPELPIGINLRFPPWFGNDKFHASHRSNLKRKNPVFYGNYNWKESSELPYYWPTKNNANNA